MAICHQSHINLLMMLAMGMISEPKAIGENTLKIAYQFILGSYHYFQAYAKVSVKL